MAVKKRTQYTIPLMVLAFLTIGGFVYWLSISTEAVRVAIAEEEEALAAAAAEDAGAMTVRPEAFSEAPEDFVGQQIRLENLQVFNQMGPEAYLVLLPNDMVYLIHFEEGAMVPPGGHTTVTGTVQIMSDSVLDAWEARGAFTDPSQREEAGYAETFLEASEIEIHTAAPPAQP